MNEEMTSIADFGRQQAEILRPTLLERAAKLNKLSEVSQVALGMCLVEIKRTEAYRPEYEDFKSYYQSELGRSKGDISKLLQVGELMLSGGFTEETVPKVGYSKLYVAFKAFPDKDVKYLIAAAQTNTMAEMLENQRDDKFGDHDHFFLPEMYKKCETCGKLERV